MSRTIKQPSHVISGVFVFLLLGLFAVFSTVMVLMGAKAYKGTADRAAEHNAQRIAGAYVRSMIRAEDAADAMETGEYDGVKTLAMREDLDGEVYVTWLYCYDGQLYEWFTSDDGYFNPESGTAICPAQRFEPRLENGLLTVDMTNGKGGQETVCVALRCAQ